MRVKRNRVGAAAARETILHLIGEDEQRSICAINVEPQTLARTQIGNFTDWIDRLLFTVPAVATTQNGVAPERRSSSMALSSRSTLSWKFESTGILRTLFNPRQRIAAPFHRTMRFRRRVDNQR